MWHAKQRKTTDKIFTQHACSKMILEVLKLKNLWTEQHSMPTLHPSKRGCTSSDPNQCLCAYHRYLSGSVSPEFLSSDKKSVMKTFARFWCELLFVTTLFILSYCVIFDSLAIHKTQLYTNGYLHIVSLIIISIYYSLFSLVILSIVHNN